MFKDITEVIESLEKEIKRVQQVISGETIDAGYDIRISNHRGYIHGLINSIKRIESIKK